VPVDRFEENVRIFDFKKVVSCLESGAAIEPEVGMNYLIGCCCHCFSLKKKKKKKKQGRERPFW